LINIPRGDAVFTVSRTFPPPVSELGLTEQVDSMNELGSAHPNPISEVKPLDGVTVMAVLPDCPAAEIVRMPQEHLKDAGPQT